MKGALLLLIAGIFASTTIRAQGPDIENYLSMMERGQAEEVRAELPALLAQYPNHPGVLYLQAALTTEGTDAVRFYQNIVDKYPTSAWADAALYKVYKFYYAIGLYRTAELKLNQLKTDYPNSRYAALLASDEPEQRENRPNTRKEPEQPRVVKAEPPTPPSRQQQPEPTPLPIPPLESTERVPGKFALQVGAFSTLANANAQKSFFEFHQYPAEVILKKIGTRELYVVLVGAYATKEDARAAGNSIQSSFNMNSIVVTR
jgi:cell division septation protein DedD